MGSTARQIHLDHDHDSERQSPQSLARQLTQQDRHDTAAGRPAPVTMLHSSTAAGRVRKPRTARVKTTDHDAANQIHGFAMGPRDTAPATPVTGKAPSLLRPSEGTGSAAPAARVEEGTGSAAPAAHTGEGTGSAAPLRAAHVAPTVAKPAARRNAASVIARAPGFVVDAARWAKHVMLGSGLAFMERVPEVLSPVAFVFANLITIVIGLAYCALPAGMGLFLLNHSPALHDAFVVSGPMKVVYMGLLYITCGFAALVGAFALRALALGLVRTLNGFAAKGQTAFSDAP